MIPDNQSAHPRTDAFVAELPTLRYGWASEERDKWIRFAEILEMELVVANDRIASLEAERDTLRGALTEVRDYYASQGTGWVYHLGYGGDKKREERLRAALAGDEKPCRLTDSPEA